MKWWIAPELHRLSFLANSMKRQRKHLYSSIFVHRLGDEWLPFWLVNQTTCIFLWPPVMKWPQCSGNSKGMHVLYRRNIVCVYVQYAQQYLWAFVACWFKESSTKRFSNKNVDFLNAYFFFAIFIQQNAYRICEYAKWFRNNNTLPSFAIFDFFYSIFPFLLSLLYGRL